MTRRNPSRLKSPAIDQLLGGISPQRFLREYWHKKPLLIRQAVPGLARLLGREGMFDLACRDDAESRLVRPLRGNWQLRHGPFEPEELEALPKRNWSLLVSGVNMLLPEGDALLDCFNFIPYARLDDLMVSYAPAGGGVGPHFDSYDVFLVQGLGKRRWEISGQDDLELVEDCPLRILKRFRVDQSWELEPGDMLYLPPKYAHNGVALGDCMTWSIGFRAPTTQEIAGQFLGYLQDTLELEGRYADPQLKYSPHAGEISDAMLRQLKGMIRKIRWDDAAMEDFAGRYLSEPKPNVFFEPPPRPLSYARFVDKANAKGIRLNARSRLLYHNDKFYINGELAEAIESDTKKHLQALADTRRLARAPIPEGLHPLLYDWFLSGYIDIVE